MKLTSTKNWKGFLGVGLVIAALVAGGCTVHGGGVVFMNVVDTGLEAGTPTDVNVAVSFVCNDNTNEARSIIHVTDTTNGANFTARLPWTPLSEIGPFGTCEQAAAAASSEGTAFAVGLINSRGQESGTAELTVSAPGEGFEACGDQQSVIIDATGSEDVLPGGSYHAEGCLDRGRINFP
ncbi:MAG TPA: hypothetical protein VJ725_33525 [Thermoanaerobaculia bacterium]|nr:hypothetical protein [Thermoanaerobaculia bacterium]